MAEIAANDDNLRIPRYISTAVVAEEIDLTVVNAERMALAQQQGFVEDCAPEARLARRAVG